MYTKALELFIEFAQFVYYGLLRAEYNFPLPRSIKFDTEIDKKAQTLLISSPEYPGLYTVTPLKGEQHTIDLVNDAIFTYFDVPRYLAKKSKNRFYPKNFFPGKKTEFVFPEGLAFA